MAHGSLLALQEFEWERTIQVEELRTLIEDDWQIPTGGQYISEEEAIHHYDQVFVRLFFTPPSSQRATCWGRILIRLYFFFHPNGHGNEALVGDADEFDGGGDK